jgi:hypothetical protein
LDLQIILIMNPGPIQLFLLFLSSISERSFVSDDIRYIREFLSNNPIIGLGNDHFSGSLVGPIKYK